jgi:hypothetical protein
MYTSMVSSDLCIMTRLLVIETAVVLAKARGVAL